MRQINRKWIVNGLLALPIAALVACDSSGSSSTPGTGDGGGDSATGPAAFDPAGGEVDNGGQFSTDSAGLCDASAEQVIDAYTAGAVPVALPGDISEVPVLSDVIAGDTLPEIPILTGFVDGASPTTLTVNEALALLEGTPLGDVPVVTEIRAVCGSALVDLPDVDPTHVIGLIPLFIEDPSIQDPDAVALVGVALVTIDDLVSGPITGLSLPPGAPSVGILDDLFAELTGLITTIVGLLGL